MSVRGATSGKPKTKNRRMFVNKSLAAVGTLNRARDGVGEARVPGSR